MDEKIPEDKKIPYSDPNPGGILGETNPQDMSRGLRLKKAHRGNPDILGPNGSFDFVDDRPTMAVEDMRESKQECLHPMATAQDENLGVAQSGNAGIDPHRFEKEDDFKLAEDLLGLSH